MRVQKAGRAAQAACMADGLFQPRGEDWVSGARLGSVLAPSSGGRIAAILGAVVTRSVLRSKQAQQPERDRPNTQMALR